MFTRRKNLKDILHPTHTDRLTVYRKEEHRFLNRHIGIYVQRLRQGMSWILVQ